MTWRAVRSATRQEYRALASLRELGFECYCPSETRWRKHARVRDKKQAPLFPGYLFARLTAEDLYLALAADGVHDVLGMGRQKQTIDPMDIASLALAESLGAFDQTWSSEPERKVFKPGDQAKVKSGQYSGFIGQVIENRGKNRVLLLVSLFGRRQKIERPVAELEAA